MFFNLDDKRLCTKGKSSIFVCDQGMKCPHCGNSDLQDDHRFCFKCGEKIFLEEVIEHKQNSKENASNAKNETNSSCGGGENKLERNVIDDKPGKK